MDSTGRVINQTTNLGDYILFNSVDPSIWQALACLKSYLKVIKVKLKNLKMAQMVLKVEMNAQYYLNPAIGLTLLTVKKLSQQNYQILRKT